MSASPVHKPLRNLDTIYCRPIGQSTCPLQCLPLPVNQRIAISRQLTKTPRPLRVYLSTQLKRCRFLMWYLTTCAPWIAFGRQWLSGGTKLYFSQKSLSLPKKGNSQIDTKDQIRKDLKIKDLSSFGKNLPAPSFSVFKEKQV